jgi:thiamine-monophosphate kinase
MLGDLRFALRTLAKTPVFVVATLDQALHGGEDYELLFHAPASRRLPAEYEGLALTRIGTMRKGLPGLVLLDGVPLAPLGYDHFRGV